MAVNIGRRELIAALGSAAAWPLVARAQGSERVHRIGMLHAVNETDLDRQHIVEVFVQSLAKLGWTEGSNLVLAIVGEAAIVIVFVVTQPNL